MVAGLSPRPPTQRSLLPNALPYARARAHARDRDRTRPRPRGAAPTPASRRAWLAGTGRCYTRRGLLGVGRVVATSICARTRARTRARVHAHPH